MLLPGKGANAVRRPHIEETNCPWAHVYWRVTLTTRKKEPRHISLFETLMMEGCQSWIWEREWRHVGLKAKAKGQTAHTYDRRHLTSIEREGKRARPRARLRSLMMPWASEKETKMPHHSGRKAQEENVHASLLITEKNCSLAYMPWLETEGMMAVTQLTNEGRRAWESSLNGRGMFQEWTRRYWNVG